MTHLSEHDQRRLVEVWEGVPVEQLEAVLQQLPRHRRRRLALLRLNHLLGNPEVVDMNLN